MKKCVLIGILFLFLVSFSTAENLYVTQNGGGSGTSSSSPMSVSQFNSASKWGSGTGQISPGDTVYFSGTFTTKPMVPGSGAINNHVVLDGYINGDCNPLVTECTSSAHFMDGFGIDGNSKYLTIQDIRSTDQTGDSPYDQALSVWFSESGEKNQDLIFRRNYFHDSGDRLIVFDDNNGERISNILFENNKVLNYGLHPDDCHAGFSFIGVDDVIIRNNIIGHNGPRRETSDNVMDWHNCKDILVENNDIFGSQSQSGPTPKESCTDNENFIFRFNKVHSNYEMGLSSGFTNKIYVYCNALYNNGMQTTDDTLALVGLRYGARTANAFSWSNLIYNNNRWGSYTWNRGGDYCGKSQNLQGNIFYFNNNFVNNGLMPSNQGPNEGGLRLDPNPNGNYRVSNNIFMNNRIGYNTRQQITFMGSGDIDALTSNTFYLTDSGTPTTFFYQEGTYRTASQLVSAGYSNNQEVNPGFNDVSNFDLTLNGNYINNAEVVSDSFLPDYNNRITINVPGETHTFCNSIQCTDLLSFSTALHPNTDWSTTPPTVVTANQNDYGSWERGAYVYTGTTSTYQCTGSIPPNAIAYDSEESSGLTVNTPWTYSATDSFIKCQYHCNTGYTWSGSSCDYSQPPPRDYTILKTNNPINLNGNLNEFTNANEIILTNSRGTTGTYKFLWDQNNLYVAAQVNDAYLNSQYSTDESDLWDDDSLEIMFDTLNNGGSGLDSENDYKFFINSLGATTDAKQWDNSFDSGIMESVIATGINNDNNGIDTGYVIEAIIPFTNWKRPVDNEVWGMNLVLNDNYGSGNDDVIWSGTTINTPNDAGDLIFSSQYVTSSSSCSSADSSGDSIVSITELINYISSWKSGSVSINELINAIGEWKNGC